MRISEVARRTGVSIRSLRYYEQKRLLCARRLSNGYRDLDEEAVKRVSPNASPVSRGNCGQNEAGG